MFPLNFSALPTFSWVKLHNFLLIVAFDQDDHLGSNKIATIFYGAHVRVGNFAEHADH